MFIVSYKASSSVMRPYQTSWVCFATRQELRQGWGWSLWDRFPKRFVLPCFRCKFHWRPSNERINISSLVFSLSSCAAQRNGHRIFCCAGVYQPWRTQQTGRQTEEISPEPATGKRSTWGIFPAPKDMAGLPASALIKFHWNTKRTGCTEGGNSWLPRSQCYIYLFPPRGILREKEEFTICLGVLLEVFWYNPDVPSASQNCHQHCLQTTSSSCNPKDTNPGALQECKAPEEFLSWILEKPRTE